jgi:hypothetical protein
MVEATGDSAAAQCKQSAAIMYTAEVALDNVHAVPQIGPLKAATTVGCTSRYWFRKTEICCIRFIIAILPTSDCIHARKDFMNPPR